MGGRGRLGRWVLALAVLGLLGPAVPAAGQAPARPDLVLVLADDLTEADWRSLPRTEALLPAAFPNYVNVDPVCCPSRATVLRGQYPHTHGTRRNHGRDGGWESFRDQEGASIAVLLRGAGYRTGLVGKYLNGYPADGGVPPGWDYWFAHLVNRPFREERDAARRDGAADRYQGYGYFDWAAVEGDRLRAYGDEPGDYATDVVAEKAVAFVAGAPADQPLFAYVAPIAPHGPATPAPRHAGACDALPLGSAGKPSLNEADVADKPAHARAAPLPLGELARLDRKRQCSLRALDELVVGLVAALEARGRPYDLVFATDNGFLLGEHRLKAKAVPYEESIRTTMRAVGPGFPAGEDRRLVGNLDLAPTFAALAGAPARADWDGRSLLAPAGLDRALIGLENWGSKGDDEKKEGGGDRPAPEGGLHDERGSPPYRGFRTEGGLTYVEYEGGTVELYDLGTDPHQLENLAAGKGPADFPAHHARVEALRGCRGAACWAAEDAPLEGADG